MEKKSFVNQTDFIHYLYLYNIPHTLKGDRIIIDGEGEVIMTTDFPENITFNNGGDIILSSGVKHIPSGTIFKNGGYIFGNFVESIDDNVTFINGDTLFLHQVKEIGDNVTFSGNCGLRLSSLEYLPDGINYQNYHYVNLGKVKDITQSLIEQCKYLDTLIRINYSNDPVI